MSASATQGGHKKFIKQKPLLENTLV